MDTPEPNLNPEIAPEQAPAEVQSELFRQPALAPRSPWGFWALVLFIAFALFAAIISSLLAFAGYAALRPIFGWQGGFDVRHPNTFLVLALQLIFYTFLLLYLWILLVVYYRIPFWPGLGWHPLSRRRALQFAALGAALSFAIEFAPTLLPDKSKFPLQELFSSPSAAYAMAAFAILVAPPIEELLFRGVLFAFFERLVGVRFAIGGTALFFAALHIQEYQGAWNHALLILVVGLVFSIARGITGSLAPCIILHMSYNATQMIVLFFVSHHFRAMPGFAGG